MCLAVLSFSSNGLGVFKLAYKRGNTLLQKTTSTTEFGETAWCLLCNLSFVLDVVGGVRETILQWIHCVDVGEGRMEPFADRA